LATDEIKYLSYAEAVLLHILLMRDWSETRYGVFDRAHSNRLSRGRSSLLLMNVRTRFGRRRPCS